ncbi:2Fe-2S iron-sulfur cluster binding domain-containing protein [Anaplasmataceae bacterium AB001_6]|nr:2Fe-2S iron-sulfur cluster binding domain-containing protein [Anaplasmataceae bacterium AB001_6]
MSEDKIIKIYFELEEGNIIECLAAKGENILTVARNNDIPLEGACEGSLACSTCHVILTADDFKRMSIATEEEEDMLDLAYDVQPTSRLGCQLMVDESFDGMVIKVPKESRNISISD